MITKNEISKPDYSDSKMNDMNWISQYQERLGKEKFNEFLNVVYGWLMNLKPGQSIDITSHEKITERNRDLFIKIGCLFISEGNSNYEFSNDFTKIMNNSHVSGKTEKNKTVEKMGRGIPV